MLRAVLLLVLVVYSSAQYGCPDVYSRHQVISRQYEEFTSLVEVKINRYDSFFERIPQSQGVVCSVRAQLEELKSLLVQCKQAISYERHHLYDKWIAKIEGLIQFSHGLCGLASSRGPEVGRVSESIVSFKQELSSFKSSFEAYDASSCDGGYLQRLESKLVELRQKWEQHQSFLSNLSVRGRLYDNTKSGGHMNAFNTNTMSIFNSYLSGNTFNQGNIVDSSVNTNTTSSYNWAPSYGRSFDRTKVGMHGNVGNQNYMGISNSSLYGNTLSQGNIHDSSRNTMTKTDTSYTGSYPYGGHGGQQGPFEGGMPGPVQGGFPGPIQGGMPGPVHGGFPGPVQGGMPGPVQGGFPGPVQGGFPGPVQGGFPGPVQGGFPGPVQGGFQGHNQEEFQGQF